MILDQRSDIEQFFLEALEQVKEEKRRKLEGERKAQIAQTQSQNFQKKGLINYIHQDKLSEQEQQKITVELSDLDWEDRERILRLLFSKMNTGQSAADWREKPENSSENRGGSSQMATGQLNQSFREQQDEEDDYGEEQDANIFDATKVPETYDRGDAMYGQVG